MGLSRWWLVALLAGLMATLAVACGGDDDAGDETSPAAATTAQSSSSFTTSPSPTKIGGSLILATTTSTQDSGLLEVLVPEFSEQTGVEVKVIAVGTGAALEMAAKGDADAVLVHAPTSEQKYIDSGDLAQRKLIMHNDFVVLGPADDPAGVKSAPDLKAAMAAIAIRGGFISRGDNSGTHTKELALWTAAGVDPAAVNDREETGQGMGATLNVANQRQAYTLSDRATFLAQRDNLDLEVLFEGEASLLNIYHAYVVNPEQHPGVKRAQAEAFVAFLVAPETQQLIAEFGKEEFGEPLFFADAGKDEASLGN